MTSASLKRPRAHKVALLALPLAIGALLLNANPSTAAVGENSPAPQFERVQFADVIEASQPAVVQISVVKRTGQVARLNGPRAPFGGEAFEEFMRRFRGGPFARGPQGSPNGKAEGLGSGFIIDTDGYIVTNNHVIDKAQEITITLHDGRELEARLVGSDPQTDLALLRVDAKNLPTISFGDSDRTRVGDWVVAIGSPFGFGGSVTAGIVSARGRDIRSGPYDDYLQIDAPINSGNSGGPIIDASGQVVGVNTAIFSPNGGNIGIGFAIPAVEAKRVINELQENGSVTRGRLGVQIQGVNKAMAEALDLDQAAGALVAEVVPGGAAARADIRPGDVITHYAGKAITEPRDLSKAVARTEPGSKASVTVVRKGKQKQLTAIVDRFDQTPLAAAPAGDKASEDALGLGLALGSLSDGTRQQMRIHPDATGALVLGIKSGSIAEAGGIQPGDIIVQVDQTAIDNASTAERALAEAKREQRPSIVLIRRGNDQFFTTMKVA